MILKVLASGSKGNCYLLRSDTGSLLIEAGLPWKQIQKGLNFDLSDVVGCLVSHEHKDHSKAMEDVLKAGIDVYAAKETFDGVEGHRIKVIYPLRQFIIRDFIVLPFPTEHDCEGSVGFLIQYKPTEEKLLFLTDSYYSKYKFKGLNYIMIECNYILDTLDENIAAGRINEAMKPRLLRSHFSLDNVINFLKANDLSQCREIVLLHLSDANSDAGRMVREITEVTGIKPVVADTGLELGLELYPY